MQFEGLKVRIRYLCMCMHWRIKMKIVAYWGCPFSSHSNFRVWIWVLGINWDRFACLKTPSKGCNEYIRICRHQFLLSGAKLKRSILQNNPFHLLETKITSSTQLIRSSVLLSYSWMWLTNILLSRIEKGKTYMTHHFNYS